MRALNPREKRIARLTAAVLSGALLYVWLVRPQLDRHGQLQEEVAALGTSLTRMHANIRLEDRIEKQYKNVRQLIRESGSASQEMSRFAGLLADLYGPLNLQVTSVRPLPDVQERYYRKYVLRLELSGSTMEIARFLANLARTPEPISVEWMDLLCKDRPGYLSGALIVSRVVTAQDTTAAGAPGRLQTMGASD